MFMFKMNIIIILLNLKYNSYINEKNVVIYINNLNNHYFHYYVYEYNFIYKNHKLLLNNFHIIIYYLL